MVQRGKHLNSKKSKIGQAAVEYVLLVALSAAVFGTMFAAIRQGMYRIWVCEIGPRVQAPTGCVKNGQCLDTIRLHSGTDATPAYCDIER
jgi:hypothetical protein